MVPQIGNQLKKYILFVFSHVAIKNLQNQFINSNFWFPISLVGKILLLKIGCPQDLCLIPFSLPMKYNLGLGVSCAWKWQMYVNEKANEKENK